MMVPHPVGGGKNLAYQPKTTFWEIDFCPPGHIGYHKPYFQTRPMTRKILAAGSVLALALFSAAAYAAASRPDDGTVCVSLSAAEMATLGKLEKILDDLYARKGRDITTAATRYEQGMLANRLAHEKISPPGTDASRLSPAKKSLLNVLGAYSFARLDGRAKVLNGNDPACRASFQENEAENAKAKEALAIAGDGPLIGTCPVFPQDNAWNQDISQLPVHPNSANYIKSIGLTGHLHADFGGGGEYGIPWVTVGKGQPKLPVNFTAYGDESDPGPYPVPRDAPIEGGKDADGDRHVLAVDTDACVLYELYRAFPTAAGWDADAGATFDLRTGAPRPAGWTSADAAGLPIFPGLARYDEAKAGAIHHALRFTVRRTQKVYVAPARHYASSSTDKNLPPMGLRLRLKASYDISKFTGQSRVVLEALKKYGMIVADNGSDWFITGDANPGWDDEDLNQLKGVPGSAFEAVETEK